LRQNTRALRSSAYQAWNSDHQSITDLMANHPGPFARQRQNQALSADDQIILEAYAFKAFSQMEVTYLQHSEGGMSDEIFNARMSGLITLLRAVPMVRAIWNHAQQFSYTPGFVAYVNEHMLRDVEE